MSSTAATNPQPPRVWDDEFHDDIMGVEGQGYTLTDVQRHIDRAMVDDWGITSSRFVVRSTQEYEGDKPHLDDWTLARGEYVTIPPSRSAVAGSSQQQGAP